MPQTATPRQRSRYTFVLLLLLPVLAAAQSARPWRVASTPTGADIRFLDVEAGLVLPQGGTEKFALTLPTPHGAELGVRLREVAVMPAPLQARYPEIRTFRGVADNGAAVAITQDPLGLHAYVFDAADPWMIEPIGRGRARVGSVLALPGEDHPEASALACGFDEDLLPQSAQSAGRLQGRRAQVAPRRYVLALACTGEFGARYGSTKAEVMAVFARAVNELNSITMTELAVEFQLHPQNDTLVFLNKNTDPYTNAAEGSNLLADNPPAINNRIPIDSYDLGHVFTNVCLGGLGGVVSGLACTSTGKARGVTCHGSRSVEAIVQSIMVHEIAHQFSVGHSWNNCPGNDGQRAGGSAFEPGSGSTIMSYQGACGPDNNVRNVLGSRPAYYHVGSLQQFRDFVTEGLGETCAEVVESANREPEIDWPYPDTLAIPSQTPFVLSASATDPDGDAVVYNWEQYDLGPATELGTRLGAAPLFRSVPPDTSGTRYLPNFASVRDGEIDPEELLPESERDLTFRLTARDRSPEGGGTVWEELRMRVVETPAPFRVTSQASRGVTLVAGSFTQVNWDVATTNEAPIDVRQVDIMLSLDNGATFPYTLAEATGNDGSEGVTLPAVNTEQARIMVRAVGNVFYSLSPSEFTIIEPTEPGFTFVPSESTVFLCRSVGDSARLDIDLFTSGFLGYDADITIRLAGDLPQGIRTDFEQTTVEPGEAAVLGLDLAGFNETDSVSIRVEAYGDGVDTARREILLDVVSQDFTDLELVFPANGEENVAGVPNFVYVPSERASAHVLQVSDEPNFGFGTIEIDDPDPAGTELASLLESNTVYFWRVLPSNRCGETFDVPINAFSTFASSCTSFTNEDPIRIPPSVATTVEAVINIPQAGAVSDLNLPIVDVSYASINAIRVLLVAPDGTSQRLYSRRCGGVDRLFTGFDDESPVEFSCAPLPNDGALRRPQNPLDTFTGKDIQGDWRLQVEVLEPNNNGGEFNAFEIEFCANVVSQSPELQTDTVRVPTGGFQFLAAPYLEASDADNTGDELEYIIVEAPARGHIDWYGTPLTVGGRFKQSSLYDGGVTYVDDGGGEGQDSMRFVLSDGGGNLIATPRLDFSVEDDALVGTAEPQPATLELSAAPNPTRGTTVITYSQVSTGGTLQLFDARGRQVAVEAVAAGSRASEVDLTGFANGLYSVTYRSERVSRTLRILVSR